MIQVSFIFPVHNEEQVLESQINLFMKKIRQINLPNFEVLLIENGSIDSSYRISKKLEKKFRQIKVLRNKKSSYGQALKKGLKIAKGNKIFIFNVDLFDIKFIKKALPLLDHVGIVIGSKTLSQSQDNRPFNRKLISYFFNIFLRLILNYPGTDTHGVKALRKNLLLTKMINICRTKNELFDTELVIRMCHNGTLLIELPQVVEEIRPTRYTLVKRIFSTLTDLIVAIKSKYFSYLNKIPVDADDFGINKKVNSAIFNSVKNEKMKIISIYANLSETNELKLISNLKVKKVLHFNILKGKPLSSQKKIPSLLDKNGEFHNYINLIIRLYFNKIDHTEIETELNSQYTFLKKEVGRVWGINSEQHLHLVSPISNIINNFSTKKKIAVRSLLSTEYYLLKKPTRFIIFNLLLLFFFTKKSTYIKPYAKYMSLITHPGTNYDKFTLL